MAVEQPAYTLQIDDGAFELRVYAPLVVAEVRVGGDMQDATNAGFRLLANYIFGGNRAQTRVAMPSPTGPVMKMIRSFRRRENMSNARSPRLVCSTTIGTRFM